MKQLKWKTYQQKAARFFRSLNLSAQIEERVSDARGKHKIDVLVTGKVHGFDLRWAVECKYWATNVSKEKVLALQSIVQDIGADKGIMLSEVGFQSGAIKVAKNTNLLLTSLADLKDEIKHSFVEAIVSSLHWRLVKVSNRLMDVDELEREHDYQWTDALQEKKKIWLLDIAFKNALVGKFPTVYALGPNETRLVASTLGELVEEADRLIKQAEEFVAEKERERKPQR